MGKRLLVTHQHPDMDAIGSVWLLKRFDSEEYGSAEVVFVPSGGVVSHEVLVDHGVERDEVEHVDTGGGKFDHHNEAQTDSSAARLVLDYLRKKYTHLREDTALERMVEFINKTDHFDSFHWPEPENDRYQFMLEEILYGHKMGGHGDDASVVALGIVCLDAIYSKFKLVVEAEQEIAEKGVVFESGYGKCLGIESSNDSVIKIGQKMGYNVVIRKDPEVGNIRIKAAPLPELDLTPVYQQIHEKDSVGTWYFHPGKHMLLNGSRKHLGQVASPLSLKAVIEIVKGVQT